jgi:uncharacterized repeat protein (TIGR02543 family)
MKNWIIGIVLAGLALSLAVTLAGCENPTGGGGSRHYTITFDADGGSEVAAISAKEGTAVSSPEDPVKAGSTFAGWFSKAEGSGELFSWPYPLTGDVTMYAGWVPVGTQPKYILTFDSNGGSDVEAVHTYAESTVIAEPAAPWKEGFTFLGWYNTPNDTGWKKYSWPYTLKSNVTMYAHWSNTPTVEEHTITFNINSKDGSPVEPITADYGASVSRPADPTRPGYTFSGWFSAASGGTLYPWPYTLTTDVTMYAHWSNTPPPLPEYTITFNSEGGSTVASITAEAGTQVAEPAEPTKSGYIFEGWYNDASGGVEYDWPYRLEANVTMYAQWEALAHFVFFNADGGIPKTQTRKVIPDASVGGDMPANPTRTNYDFGGWWTERSGDGSVFTADTTVTANIVVWAKWTPVCTITFNGNGGSPETQTRIVKSGSAVGTGNMPINPTRTGCAFGGWYTEAAGGGSVFTASTPVTADITVYAKWNRNPAFIVLDFEPEISNGTGWTFANNVYTISSGANVTVTGTTTTRRIEVPAGVTGVTITLQNANIQAPDNPPLKISKDGAEATVILSGVNILTATARRAGISAPGGSTLTITSVMGDGSEEGSLTASGANGAAGIGASWSYEGDNGGVITIKGGTITAIGGGGSGIGAASYGNAVSGSGGVITITGGKVTATANSAGSGIGGAGDWGGGGTIKITGGTVIAGGRTGIGAHIDGGGGEVEISGGTVTATGTYGAGIGWERGNGGTVKISGGVVTATGDTGIGGRRGDGLGTIEISGGVVTATGINGAGIGSGNREGNSGYGVINIIGGVITAKGSGSGIGGKLPADTGTIVIKGGSINASSTGSGQALAGPPINGSGASVYLNTLTVGATPPAIDTAITEGSIDNTPCTRDGEAGYGIKDVKTDAAGNVYFWLPATAEGENGSVSLTAGGAVYLGEYERTSAGNTETLVIP